MKEATGELNMTVITVVALAAVAALFYAFVWPMIKARLVSQTCDTMGAGYHACNMEKDTCTNNGGFPAEEDEADETGEVWCCVPETVSCH